MPVDAQTQAVLDSMGSFELSSFEVTDLRKWEKLQLPSVAIERVHVAEVRDQQIPGQGGDIPLRIYTPKDADKIGGATPIAVYFHGGGHTIGSIDGSDGLCCRLTRSTGCIVVSVDYRLAPENKFPAAPEDCYSAVQWCQANAASLGGDRGRIAVMGDSAGGNLAAAVCLMARDRGTPSIRFQVLLYPPTNARRETASSLRNGKGYLLTKPMMDWYSSLYMNGPEDALNPYCWPLVDKSHIGLPPALVITAEFDPLLDEGKAYADALSAAGIPAEYKCYEGTIHGFVSFYRVIDKGCQAIDLIGEQMRQALA